MKALITGIDGFVGGYLVEHLIKQGLEVYGTSLVKTYDNPKCKAILYMDLTDKANVNDVISQVEPSYIFHLAGQSSVGLSWKQPELTFNVNVIGTIHLLEAVRVANCESKILIVGSSDQYGIITPDDCPISEKQVALPQNPYATSKKAQEEIALQYKKAYGMQIVLVRAFNHIGPGQREGFVVADFASQIAKIEKGMMPPKMKVGNLEARRDFTDVRDIVKAYYLLMTKGTIGEIYNVGSGKSHKIRELLDKLIDLCQTDIEVEKDMNRMRPSDIPLIECDYRKIKRDCGWEPENDLDTTLLDTLNYWRNN